jgi:hypothetical protein
MNILPRSVGALSLVVAITSLGGCGSSTPDSSTSSEQAVSAPTWGGAPECAVGEGSEDCSACGLGQQCFAVWPIDGMLGVFCALPEHVKCVTEGHAYPVEKCSLTCTQPNQ